MIQHKLNMLKTIPINGVVLCSGDFKLREYKSDISNSAKTESYV